mgnify:CR=1 FL=1
MAGFVKRVKRVGSYLKGIAHKPLVAWKLRKNRLKRAEREEREGLSLAAQLGILLKEVPDDIISSMLKKGGMKKMIRESASNRRVVAQLRNMNRGRQRSPWKLTGIRKKVKNFP